MLEIELNIFDNIGENFPLNYWMENFHNNFRIEYKILKSVKSVQTADHILWSNQNYSVISQNGRQNL